MTAERFSLSTKVSEDFQICYAVAIRMATDKAMIWFAPPGITVCFEAKGRMLGVKRSYVLRQKSVCFFVYKAADFRIQGPARTNEIQVGCWRVCQNGGILAFPETSFTLSSSAQLIVT